ncbi:hypothetical protein AMIS_11070 [Actinoplanes missouriensis 431]|uniref:Uncharacterized protein n=1 Tax=Actinoplanes missouriensis (strain ATCC 14538 / DSM 43046 / CBS 188.64 / JCM 3121 / NBRC 102363 / NCIMB 12654 / NRRL B-3342 / UNCC 431) TaxID=512565 RepID=I0GZZ0_ACTM4|nr:hypothetical protein AMIS_11070 [Actinoplanes missouriensis 431]
MPESESTSTIGVQRGVWADLPPDVAGLVAPPVIVTANPLVPASSRSPQQMPVGGLRGHSG